MTKHAFNSWVTTLLVHTPTVSTSVAGPINSNIRAAQRPGMRSMDIDYNLTSSDSGALAVSVTASYNDVASHTVSEKPFPSALEMHETPGLGKRNTRDTDVDLPNKFSANAKYRVPPINRLRSLQAGLSPIPKETFTKEIPLMTRMLNGDEYSPYLKSGIS